LYRDLIIVNELGLHARSAAQLAKTARKADKGVWLQLEDRRVDAKQVLDILTLGAGQGACIRVGIEQAQDMPTLEQIVALINAGFGE
jgi:phosphocarrier protein HPr